MVQRYNARVPWTYNGVQTPFRALTKMALCGPIGAFKWAVGPLGTPRGPKNRLTQLKICWSPKLAKVPANAFKIA